MGARSILVGSDDERLATSLAIAGFAVVPLGASWLDMLEDEVHRLVLVDDGCAPEVLAHLRGVSGGRRRDLFVVRWDAEGVTGDRTAAWRQSVDLVVNPADVARLGALVDEGVAEKQAFYARFREIAGAQGDA